jgi:hypothetical protein
MQFLRSTETTHQRNVLVTENVEAVAPRHVDTECFEQRLELPFEKQFLVPRGSVTRSKEQAAFIGMPRLEERSQVLTGLW